MFHTFAKIPEYEKNISICCISISFFQLSFSIMRSALKISFFFLIALVVISSCNKSPVVSNQSTPRPPNPVAPNRIPTAIAGQDISVNYDLQTCKTTDTIILNGGTSFDPDGMIVSYLWKGPGLIPIAYSSTTQVSNLIPGLYKYVLVVTDDKGAIGTDTVTVSIVSMNR